MKIALNGEPKETGAGSVAELVRELGLPERAVLVELNGLALRRDEWPAAAIKGGDCVEVIRVVAGG